MLSLLERWDALRALFPDNPANLPESLRETFDFWMGAGDQVRVKALADLGGQYIRPVDSNRKEEKSRDLVLSRAPRPDGQELPWDEDTETFFGDLADEDGNTLPPDGGRALDRTTPTLEELAEQMQQVLAQNKRLVESNAALAAKVAGLEAGRSPDFIPTCTYELRPEVRSRIPNSYRDRKTIETAVRGTWSRTQAGVFGEFPPIPKAEGFWKEQKSIKDARISLLEFINSHTFDFVRHNELTIKLASTLASRMADLSDVLSATRTEAEASDELDPPYFVEIDAVSDLVAPMADLANSTLACAVDQNQYMVARGQSLLLKAGGRDVQTALDKKAAKTEDIMPSDALAAIKKFNEEKAEFLKVMKPPTKSQSSPREAGKDRKGTRGRGRGRDRGSKAGGRGNGGNSQQRGSSRDRGKSPSQSSSSAGDKPSTD